MTDRTPEVRAILREVNSATAEAIRRETGLLHEEVYGALASLEAAGMATVEVHHYGTPRRIAVWSAVRQEMRV